MTLELRELPGSNRPALGDLTSLGRIPDDEQIMVSVYMKPRGAASAAVPGQATIESRSALRQGREAVHADDISAVSAFADSAGLTVIETDVGRRLIQLKGTVSALEHAFGTELHQVQDRGMTCRARTGGLHLPAALIERVSAVLGLDTRPVATAKIVPHRGTTQPTGFLPTEVAELYGFAGTTAPNQCIGIIELGGGFTDADNVSAFAAMGVPVPSIVAVGVDGGKNAPGDGSGADGEVALDIQVAGGVARGAKLAVYFAPNTNQGFVDAISQAVHDEDNKPTAISISWGSAESGWSGQAIAAMSAAFQDAVALGITVTAASGDSLATDGVSDGKAHVDYPASDPSVLGCGGTRITGANGKITAETVWKSNGGGTGGGVSVLFAKPAYQANVNVPKASAAKGGRGVPDVSGDADPDSGYRIVTGGQTGLVGGTSAVAPLWAAIAALLNSAGQSPVGDMHAKLYGTPSALRDIVSGDNKSGTIGYSASQGWDPCTGLGSPDGAKLRTLFGKSGAKAGAATPSVSLFKLTGLDGNTLLVALDAIFRIRATLPTEGQPATRVDYGGAYLFTHETIAELLSRIGSSAHFVRLTQPSGSAVYLAATAIVSVGDATPDDGPGAEVTVSGDNQHVLETVQQVEALLA